MEKCNTKIAPLIKDLKGLHLGEYLKSSAYQRFLVKNELDELWREYYDCIKKESNIIGPGLETWYCENALVVLLDHFFNQPKYDIFFSFVLEFLASFTQFNKAPLDLSEIIADIEILSPPQGLFDELQKLGQDYPEPIKASPIQKEKAQSNSNSVAMPKLFISHASDDAQYVEKLVGLLEHIGLQKEHFFCSSVPEYGIPLGHDIFDYLKKQFKENDLYVIFALSENYYESAACLNEMGAAWVLQSNYQALLLPGFDFKNIKGAINPGKMSFNLDNKKERRTRTNELKESILSYLGITPPDSDIWERHRENFFDEIDKL